MISVCRFSLHRHSFHVILFDCRISSLFAADIWISYLFIFANYFTVLQWFHFILFFYLLLLFRLCVYLWLKKKKEEEEKVASAVCQFFHSRRLNESRRTVLNVRRDGGMNKETSILTKCRGDKVSNGKIRRRKIARNKSLMKGGKMPLPCLFPFDYYDCKSIKQIDSLFIFGFKFCK